VVPSSRELIESIRQGLTDQVAPSVSDKLALSVLRSVDALLEHLAVRVVEEPVLLAEDNADLRNLLGLPPVDEAGPSVEELTARNRGLREQLDAALESALAQDDRETIAEIDAYLGRRLQREEPMILPAFAGRVY
jgi:hypothetical protein